MIEIFVTVRRPDPTPSEVTIGMSKANAVLFTKALAALIEYDGAPKGTRFPWKDVDLDLIEQINCALERELP